MADDLSPHKAPHIRRMIEALIDAIRDALNTVIPDDALARSQPG